MQEHKKQISLGFINEKIPAGSHLCLVYSNESERVDSLFKFLLSGLEAGERSIGFSEKTDEEALRKFLLKHNISFHERKQDNTIPLSGVHEVYFEGGEFDPGNFNILHAKNGKAAKKIKAKFPGLPIIAQTAYSTESDKKTALQHGFQDFIAKPLEKERLFELVDKYIN